MLSALNEAVLAGRMAEATSQLQQQLRRNPASGDLLLGLFALECAAGNYSRAEGLLDGLGALGAAWLVPSQIGRQLIRWERERQGVYSRQAVPRVLGPEPEWLDNLLKAGACDDSPAGQQAAMALRTASWDACPGLAGQIDGRAFDWLSDADPRLGATFEVFCAQGYVWVPFANCEFVEFPPTEVWLDWVWRPVKCQLGGGDLVEGFMPVRYSGTEASGDGGLCLARRTEWQEQPAGGQFPVGQRLFVWGEGDAPMLGCRRIEFVRPASTG